MAQARRARHAAWPFVLVGAAWFAVMASSNLATPLYAVYEHRFGFSSAVLTRVFATYALVLAPSLLVFGQLSDAVGRRVVLLGGLALAIAGLMLFAFARGTPWLFAARSAQGVAVGAVSGTTTAALAAGALAQWAPLPRVVPFLVGIAATVLAGAAIVPLPEPAPSAGGRWRIQRPRVPSERRARFARVSVTGAAVWAVAR